MTLSTEVFFMMSWMPFSLVIWFSLSQWEGLEYFSAKTVRSWINKSYTLTVLTVVELWCPPR